MYRSKKKKSVPVPTLMQHIVELGEGHKTNNSTDGSIITNQHASLEEKEGVYYRI